MKAPAKYFEGKVIAITGASSGIGRALAITLAQEGAFLALADINAAELLKTSTLIGNSTKVHTTIVDVSNRLAIHQWADTIADHYGKINIIINNAGAYLKGSIEDSSFEEIERLLNINLYGVIYGTKAFLPYLHASGDGHVVNMSSLYGLIAMPTSGIYSTTKFAIRGFTECLQQELELTKACVSATCIYPGGIKTNIMRNGEIALHSQLYNNKEDVIQKAEKDLNISPEKAALIIVDGIRKKKKQIIVGKLAYFLHIIQRIFPIGYQLFTKQRIASRKYPAPT